MDSFMVADEFQPEFETPVTEPLPGNQVQAVDLDGHIVQVEFEDVQDLSEEEDDDEGTAASIGSSYLSRERQEEEDVDGDLEEETTETVIDIGEDGTRYSLESVPQQRFRCPDGSCRLRLPSKAALSTHMKNCHYGLSLQLLDDEEGEEYEDEEDEFEDALVISELDAEQQQQDESGGGQTRINSCPKCSFTTVRGSLLLEHMRSRHLYQRSYACPHCHLLLTRKFHLVRHIKTVHENVRFWECDSCDYKSNNQTSFKKHIFKCTQENTWDLYSEASVPKGVDFKCVCTWCEYKSNKYSMIKKHVEIFHEKKKHYSCKECVFIGRTVDDYAEHYNSFHKTDSYRHACADCSFKCTNRLDLRNHYIDVHNKQRLYACKLCTYKAQDVITIKKHLARSHSSLSMQCRECNFNCKKKSELTQHCAQNHGVFLDVTCNTPDTEILEVVEEEVLEEEQQHFEQQEQHQQILEEQILEEQILEEQILEEHILEEQVIAEEIYNGVEISL